MEPICITNPKISERDYTVNQYFLVVSMKKRRKDYRFNGWGKVIKVPKIQESAIIWF